MIRRIKHNAPAVAKAVGHVIRTHRKAKKLTQEGVANAAEVDRGYLQKIEKGLFQPTVAVFIDLAIALGATPDALLGEVVRDLTDPSST